MCQKIRCYKSKSRFYLTAIKFYCTFEHIIIQKDSIGQQVQNEDSIKRFETINQSLDERRDMMLFDEDPDYWKMLEELAG